MMCVPYCPPQMFRSHHLRWGNGYNLMCHWMNCRNIRLHIGKMWMYGMFRIDNIWFDDIDIRYYQKPNLYHHCNYCIRHRFRMCLDDNIDHWNILNHWRIHMNT